MISIVATLSLMSVSQVPSTAPFDWRDAVLYHVETDRFFDGDPKNNARQRQSPRKKFTAEPRRARRDREWRWDSLLSASSPILCALPLRSLRLCGDIIPVFRDIAVVPKNNANIEKRNPGGWHGGDFRGLLAKIDYLKSLGVNAVWFSPVTKQVDKPHRTTKLTHWPFHGYWPARSGEIEPRFGSRVDLVALTKGLRAAGFRVVLDVVLNHVGYGATHAGIRTPCGKDEFTKCLFGLPDLRTEDPAVWEPLVKATKQLVDDTGADAVRLDAANHIAPAEWRTFRRAIATPLLIGELWGFDPAAEKSGDALRARDFDTAFDFAFADLALGWVTGRLATESLAKHLAKRDAVVSAARVPPVHFLDTHDTEPFLSRARRDKSALKLAAALQFAVAGIPLVNYGNEVGRTGGRWPTNRGDMPWGAAQDKRLLEFYKRLIYARRVDPNLRRAKSTVSALSRDLLMVLRGETVVLLNRGRRRETAKVAVANAKSWVDLLTEKKLAAKNLTVPPRTARILVRAE